MTDCQHHWVFPTPAETPGPTAVGKCSKCGDISTPHITFIPELAQWQALDRRAEFAQRRKGKVFKAYHDSRIRPVA